jgi:hypothetical protein
VSLPGELTRVETGQMANDFEGYGFIISFGSGSGSDDSRSAR